MTRAHPPSVSSLLESERGRALAATHGHKPTVAALRAAIGDGACDGDEIVERAGQSLSATGRAGLRPVWNLTGVVLHTNLGRAILPDNAVAAAAAAMARPVAVEYDLETGKRGERDSVLRDHLRAITGAEDAVLVNNNAAAVMLVLDTLAKGGEVIVSRGELIEIGGSFRMPDIMAATGARLVEVGTTNRTHLKDYRAAIGENTRLIMKVHPSNFRMEGFTSEVTAAELAPLAREHGIPLANDLGSGTLVDISRYGLPKEPTVAEAVAEGADIVTFSGDKLLGGPQAGFAIGTAEIVGRLAKNPMKRALRLDKVRLAALEAVLHGYRTAANAEDAVPTLAMLARPVDEIAARARALAPELARILGPGWSVAAADCRSQVGSGASPTATLPSAALTIRPADGQALEDLAARWRQLGEPVIGRIAEGALWLDLRCLARRDEDRFIANLEAP